ncbi:hypothetical protein AX16_008212 [Volvariella volvacea WC 439]|nr:hypothetical protein AX16_008212 [Volvariella volvacea WC 439]
MLENANAKALEKHRGQNNPPEVDEEGAQAEDGERAGAQPQYEPFDQELLPSWRKFSLHPQLLRGLHRKQFDAPTPIQAASLPHALSGKDVIGVAQTGSGKTLAYGLPILHHLLSQPPVPSKSKRPVKALVLAPTRELALQVSSHLNAYLTPIPYPKASESEGGTEKRPSQSQPTKKPPPHVSCAAIVGGMSSQKQRRILDRGVDVLVATPGRLWDIMEEDDDLAKQIKHLRFLVLDEADRMIEAGHFAELENILRLTLRENENDQIPAGEDEEEQQNLKSIDTLQTFVFSATLSKDLQQNLKRRKSRSKSSKKRSNEPATTLGDLLLRLDFRDPDPEVIDLSPVGGVVATLKESKIECLTADKDVYLYYFLLRYPGRSVVFLSSIDGIRRLMPLMELLNVKAFPLHSQLEQRQRLKNLDRFKSIQNSVLLATDIAARGLDIPEIDHVIHYQVPRTADAYVHRNGRTARAMRKGFSMLMCAPDERRIVKALMHSLSRDEEEIPEMPIELGILDQLKERVQLARRIETENHKVRKSNHEKNWVKETADAMDIELDSDFLSNSDDEEVPSKQQRKKREVKNAALKAELKQMLAQPLLAKGVSARYITSGSRPVVDGLLSGDFNEVMIGLKNVEAGADLVQVKRKKKRSTTKSEGDGAEWSGIGN